MTVRSDYDIQLELTRVLINDPRIDTANVHVRVSEGVVYLSGTVPNPSQKHLVVDTARNIAGAFDVVDELIVAPQRSTTA